MGIELSGGTLYAMESSGRQLELGDISYGSFEVDTCSPNETPDICYHLTSAANASLEITATDLECLAYKPFEPSKDFWFEHKVAILVQARWHKKKRINKKWLKRYGMKPDTVKIRAKARALDYGYLAGEFDFEVDKYEYIWRPDQLRRSLKIEFEGE
jgi:hypothetical protein